MLELVRRLGELGGAEGFEPEFAPARTGEVQRIAIDPARAERELGWRAEVGLEEGLRLTLASICHSKSRCTHTRAIAPRMRCPAANEGSLGFR